ncbi:hypothetical protein F2P79_014867 [Pimephales promelas]|nr:hypothetical protein F2P79_014867 [Pimephales promelas]
MSCCAVGCQNRKSVNKDLKFYRIPSTHTPFNANRRRLWLQAIRRIDWNDNLIKNARLCSSHFISGEVSMDSSSPDFVPSVFSYSTQCQINKGDAKLERFKRKRTREETTHRPPDHVHLSTEVTDEVASESSAACLSSDDCRMEPGSGPFTEATVPKVLHDELKLKYSQLSAECVNLRSEINKLKSEKEELKETLRKTQFSFSSIKSKAVHVLFFTGWGGRVSDKQITAESGFYDLLEHNDEILADRGFTIRDELATRGATLRIPHFTKGKKQLSAQEVDTSRRLSNVDLLDDMVIVCGALTNLCKCIVPRR